MHRRPPEHADGEVYEVIHPKFRYGSSRVDADLLVVGQRDSRLEYFANPKSLLVVVAVRHHPIFAEPAKPLLAVLAQEVVAQLFGSRVEVAFTNDNGIRVLVERRAQDPEHGFWQEVAVAKQVLFQAE